LACRCILRALSHTLEPVALALPRLFIPSRKTTGQETMFERYTQKARRVIFFARYEASQFGSSTIETEHILLGLLREDRMVVQRYLGPNSDAADIRAEIEKHITRGERVSTSVEMPLSTECSKLLMLAAEEAQRLAHRYIGTEHLLLALSRVEGSLAARLLRQKGLKPEAMREQLVAFAGETKTKVRPQRDQRGIATLGNFLAGLKWYNWEQLAPFFAQNSQFVDSSGHRWKEREEIEKQFEVLFAPYARKNVTFLVEGTDRGPADSLVASVLWENVRVGRELTRALHRMTILLAPEGEEWAIFLLQVTPIVVH